MTQPVRKAAFATAAVAVAALMVGSSNGWAASSAPALPPGATELPPVEVVVPRLHTGSHIRRDTSEWRMSVRVPYGDLDMQSPSGVAELNRRVDAAADYVCTRLEDVEPSGEPNLRACARDAVNDAKPQVLAAQGR